MKIITVANQKGGVGKTTTALNIAGELTRKNYSVLLIDLDAQCNLTYSTGAYAEAETIYSIFKKQSDFIDVVQSTPFGNIIPGSPKLAGIETEFTSIGKEFMLKEVIEIIPSDFLYDFILIDTPPTLGLMLINSLAASTHTLVPIQADAFSMQGMGQLLDTINSIKKYINHSLDVVGVLLTRYNKNAIINRDLKNIIEAQCKSIDIDCFTTHIREGVAVREAQLKQIPLYKTSPKGKPTEDFTEATNELLRRISK